MSSTTEIAWSDIIIILNKIKISAHFGAIQNKFKKCVQDAPFPAEQSAKNKFPSPAVLSGNDHRFRG